jgi:hypothetical protein
LQERFAARGNIVVAHLLVALGVDHSNGREDATYEIGTAGRDVFVGGREQ